MDITANISYILKKSISYQRNYPLKNLRQSIYINYYLEKNNKLKFSLIRNQRNYNSSRNNNINQAEFHIRNQYSFSYTNEINTNTNTKQKVLLQIANYETENKSNGILFYYQISKKIKQINYHFRYTIFNTDNYNTRFYNYQNNAYLHYNMEMLQL